jgi:tyrosyl-tRNA synthetase
MGGSDQWGNIVAGIELVRRIQQESVFGITFPLITTSGGAKMGKTAAGAVWLDPERTSAYDYYQYWVNTDDRDVERFLALFTFLPLDEIRAVGRLSGSELNQAKSVLAFEATQLAHGTEAALNARQKTIDNFGRRDIETQLLPTSTIPRQSAAAKPGVNSDAENPEDFDSEMALVELQAGIPAFKLFHAVGLAKSGGAARRLIEQGGAYVNTERIDDVDRLINPQDVDSSNMLVLRSGKKRYHKIKLKK